MIGQFLMTTFPETELDTVRDSVLIDNLVNGRIGGLIFFKFNVKNKSQFEKLITDLRSIETPYPLLLAIDEEGGRVRRLRKRQGFDEFPSPQNVASNYGTQEAEAIYRSMANQIADLGLNMNLGPVVDLNINPENPAIGKLQRSYGIDPELVTSYSEIFINAHHSAGILTALKHYPGHGSSRGDSHIGLTDITHTWRLTELAPFEALIRRGNADVIMVGHLMDTNVDETYPSSLSKAHINGRLRNELGFDGVVMTDDLQMGAIGQEFSLEERVLLALQADCDILQFSDPGDLNEDFPRHFQELVLNALESDQLDMESLRISFNRIIELKFQLLESNGSGKYLHQLRE
jgi:beta-N-acetylhexosaminidase